MRLEPPTRKTAASDWARRPVEAMVSAVRAADLAERFGEESFQVGAGDVGVGEGRRQGDVGVGVAGQGFFGAAHVLAEHAASAAVGHVLAGHEGLPVRLFPAGEGGADVVEQELVDVGAAEVGVAMGGEDLETGRNPLRTTLTSTVPPPTSSTAIAAPSGRPWRAAWKTAAATGSGTSDDVGAEAVACLAEHAGADRAPVGGVGEHEQVDGGTAGYLPGFAYCAGKHRADHVDDRQDAVAEQQVAFVDAAFRVGFVAGRVDRGLAFGFLADEQGAVGRGEHRGGHHRGCRPRP